MSENLRRYRAIHEALKQWYPGEPSSNRDRHLTTLAALISGIVASRSSQLPQIATKIPDGNEYPFNRHMNSYRPQNLPILLANSNLLHFSTLH